MFDGVGEAELVATVTDACRAEAAAAGLRTAAIAELVSRRIADDGDDPRNWWVADLWDSTAAEVAAAMNISHRKASGQMRIAETLRDHLPAVTALFQAGLISARVVAVITWRTRLITDDQVWAGIDTELADRALGWGPLSQDKLTAALDTLIQRFDPAAVITATTAKKSRDFTVGHVDDEAGVAAVWGTLLATDAEVLKQKVTAIAATVCDHDPRSAGERRSDAAGAALNGLDHLICRCGSPSCPAAARPAPASPVVITVIADQTALDAAGATIANSATSPTDRGVAVLPGGGVLPTPMLAELLRGGATLQPLCVPDAQPEPRYRPSARLARWIRTRDMTCRFPGCTVAAQFCDIDHVIPYPIGATHPANLACLCRKHHLLKTFWVGDWSFTLKPDGTAIWTSPTGTVYTTHPGSRAVFPGWDTTTAEATPPSRPREHDYTPITKMPTRTRTRTADRAARITTERTHNTSDPPTF